MSQQPHRIEALSPVKRELFNRRVRELSAEKRAIPKRRGDGPACLSPLQERLWFLEQLEPENTTYILSHVYRIRGLIERGVLENALSSLTERHESLRSAFRATNDQPIQIILPPVPFNLPLLDLTHEPATLREDHAQKLTVEFAQTPFDFHAGYLFRAHMIRMSSDDHIFQFSIHHIISDGWSMAVLLGDLSLLYGSMLNKVSPDLPKLPIQYADYAVWQRKRLAGDRSTGQLRYWIEHLKGVPVTLDLPYDKPGQVIRTQQGRTYRATWPIRLCRSLDTKVLKSGVTTFMTLLAAFTVALHRWTGQENLSFGIPVAGRPREETEGLIGFFINTVVLRVNLSNNPTFKELLERIRRLTIAALENQDVPFDRVVAELRPHRIAGTTPLLQALFGYQKGPETHLRLPNAKVKQLSTATTSAKVDLSFELLETPEKLSVQVDYSTDVFDTESVARMCDQYRTVLEAGALNPDCPIGKLPLMTQNEQRQINSWNNTASDYLKAYSISRLVEGWARQNPESVAVVGTTESLTYQELNDRANRLACRLIECGVLRGAPVGVFMERCPEMVVTMLAVLKAGGAYMPLDPHYPSARLLQMLNDSRAMVIVTQETFLSALPDGSHHVLCVEELNLCPNDESANDLAFEPDPDDLAYIMFTSGSTGRPKGVAVSHRAIMRLVVATDYLQLSREDVVAQVSNACFDAATWEIWGPLTNGGRLVLIPMDVFLSPEGLAAAIDRHGITAMFVTTALFNRIAQDAPCTFAGLKTLLFGGERSDPKAAARVLSNRPPRKLIHLYGPTEATTFATWYLVESIPNDVITIPIGKPIANTTVHVMDRYSNPVPVGVTGELYIGGPGLAREYFNDPELTAEKFVTQSSGERFYKTGDLARRLRDGNIEFLGRLDDQLKIRGFRIEPEEVASALRAMPENKEAAVIAREDEFVGKHLIAYVVPDRGQRVSSETVRTYLKKRLPDYMIPASFVTLEFLPLTSSGKLDRSSLPIPSWKRSDISAEPVAPRTSTEKRLAAVWLHLLKYNKLGVHDNYFDVGGDSLLGAKLVTDIRTEFQVDIPLQRLFESPTIAEMATWLEKVTADRDEMGQSLAGSPGHSLVGIQKGHVAPALFFVPGGGGGDSTLLVYARLARQMGSDIPFYGFLACGLDGVSHPHTSVKKMAAAYIDEIRALQPSGPYFLAGECVGGVVAFEIARQLKTAGQRVAFLALLDTYYRSLRYYSATFFKKLSYQLKNCWKIMVNSETEGSRMVRILHLIVVFLGDEIGLVWPNKHPDSPEARRWYKNRVEVSYQRVLQRYRPGKYTGNVLFLVSKDTDLEKMEADWRPFISGNIEIRDTPGTHMEYLRDHSQTAGRILRDCFEQARQDVQ